jgi:drug/metabolite transporter (DMT)-like permease
MSRPVALLVALALTAIGVAADIFLKLASAQPRPTASLWFAGGLLCFASTAFGWVIVMQRLKLATVGGIYAVGTVLFLALIGVVGFRETLNRAEIAGLLFAVISLVLLGRFGG